MTVTFANVMGGFTMLLGRFIPILAVLAVAGAVRDQPPWVLFAGLAISVAMTGFAAVGVARLLHRWPWIGYIGVFVVLFVASHMMWDGAGEMGWLKL